MGPHVVIRGNPITGYKLTGPFPDAASATAWATNHLEGTHWWTQWLEAPDAPKPAAS